MNRQQNKSRKFRTILLIVLLTLVIVVTLGALFAQKWYTTEISNPVSDDSSTVQFTIEKGTSAADIGKILSDNGIMVDQLAWQIYVKLNSPKILADKYDLPKNLSIEQIVAVLEKGQEDEVVWVTIPEGLRMDEIEKILAEKLTTKTNGSYSESDFHKLINSPDDYLASTSSLAGAYVSGNKPDGKSLEGFLFPDTYAFRTDVTAQEVLTTLLENFMKKTKDITTANGLSFYDNLILASIVEREAGPNDYSGVAGVFLKRMDQGEKLGSDITVLYALKRWTPEPTAAELNINSPYNTRLNYGLPPTPISNPGVASVKDTGLAKAGDYLFFIADEDGMIHYGKNISEHNHNVCKYLTKTCN